MIWQIKEKEDVLWYTSDACQLKIIDNGNEENIWINYKGYNIVMPMEMWEFGEEITERGIKYHVAGGRFEDWYYVIDKKDLRLFIDLIYFFIKEHDSDGMIHPHLRVKEWN